MALGSYIFLFKFVMTEDGQSGRGFLIGQTLLIAPQLLEDLLHGNVLLNNKRRQ